MRGNNGGLLGLRVWVLPRFKSQSMNSFISVNARLSIYIVLKIPSESVLLHTAKIMFFEYSIPLVFWVPIGTNFDLGKK